MWRLILGELVAHDALVVLGKGLGAFEVTVCGAPLPPYCCAWLASRARLLLLPAFVLLPLLAFVFPASALRAPRTRAQWHRCALRAACCVRAVRMWGVTAGSWRLYDVTKRAGFVRQQARFLAIHAAPSSLVLLINAPKAVQARLELRHRTEVPCAAAPFAYRPRLGAASAR